MEIAIPDWITKSIAGVVGAGIVLLLAKFLLGLTWGIEVALGI